jgi:hypothetical protein
MRKIDCKKAAVIRGAGQLAQTGRMSSYIGAKHAEFSKSPANRGASSISRRPSAMAQKWCIKCLIQL